jgi:hypothetical protein
MSNNVLRQRFNAVVNNTSEPSMRRYLEEAYRCFVAEAFTSMVVMLWNAVAYYLRRVVKSINVGFFEYNYETLYGEKPPEDLIKINDNRFIRACESAGILGDVIPILDRLRRCRNECAHPTGIFVSMHEALELIESLINVISLRIEDQRLTKLPALKEFARITNERDGEAIAQWVHEGLCPQLAHDLLTMFEREDKESDVSGIIGLWRGLWNRLDAETQQRLWDRIERIVQNTLSDVDNALRTPEQLVRLIVWPAPDAECPPRDRIGELFVDWLEGLAQSGQFRYVDGELAYGLRAHLPIYLRDRLDELLVTWLEGLAQSATFGVEHMEFARRFRRQDLSTPRRERLQAAFQEMVRRYAE